MEFVRVNERITYVRVKCKLRNVTIIDEAKNEEKDRFYTKLDITIIAGDMNAKIEKEK